MSEVMTEVKPNERILKLVHRLENMHNYQFNMDVVWIHWPKRKDSETMCGCIAGWALYLSGYKPRRQTFIRDFMKIMNLPEAAYDDTVQLLMPHGDRDNKFWQVGEARTRTRAIEALRKFAATHPEKKLGAR